MAQTPATRTETNREIIRQAFDAWRQGTAPIAGVFAPGMVWRIEGHSAASKQYHSKQQFIWDGHGIATDGQPYQNSYAWIMKLADGKVIDGTAFFDSISFNDLWARVQP
jgi:uncharacterized protein